MKKATKIFICLLSVVLLIFFATKAFGSEILYESFLAESNSIFCKLKGGKVFVDSNTSKIRTCIMKYKDVGKSCNDNVDCEGFCFIEDDEILKKKLLELCEEKNLEYDSCTINADELAKKTGVEIKGYCSNMRCATESKIIVVNNKVRIGEMWGCPGHFE